MQGTLLLIASAFFLAGCTVGPNYIPPKVQVQSHFAEGNPQTDTNPPPADWWKTFNDPELDTLIHEALTENYDLLIAYNHVRQSRYQRNIVAADLFPQVDADAGYLHARGSQNVQLPLGGSSSGSGGASGSGSSGGSSGSSSSASSPAARLTRAARSNQSSQPGSQGGNQAGAQNDAAFDDQLNVLGKGGLPGKVTDLYQAGFDMNWEIDVFGARRRQLEAAAATVAEQEENRRQMALTVMAEVARDYFELRGVQQRLDIARQNLAAQSNLLLLTQSRAHVGLLPDADVVRAQAEVDTTESTLPPLLGQIQTLGHALSILVGKEPNTLKAELSQAKLLPPTPPVVSIGLPSQLLERRPDIRAAERNIAVANAQVGSAVADLFPKFALTGTAGLDSTSLDHLFDWQSRYFLISPTVTWRIFDAGRILNNIKLQRAMTDEASLQYRQTLLTALQEVEDALVNYATELERQNKINAAYGQNQVALELMQKRYEHGLVTFLDVLDAERTVLSSQDELAQSTATSVVDLVAIYKALGGGWQSVPAIASSKK